MISRQAGADRLETAFIVPFRRATFEGVLLIMHTSPFSFKVTGPGASGCAAHVCVTPVVYERRSSEDERGGGCGGEGRGSDEMPVLSAHA